MTAEVSEIELVKLLFIALTEKIHCWSDIVLVKHLLFIAEKQLRFSTGFKEKKQADKFLFCFFKLYLLSTLITYNSITNFCPAFSIPFRLI